MAHMICENDKGFVFGTTWHGLEQYVQKDVPVTSDECFQVLSYPMEKRENHVLLNGAFVPNGSFSIVRTDHEKVLVPSVGADFEIINNDHFFRSINESLLVPNSNKLHVESVGTLCNGQVAFVNIALNTINIKGDQSDTNTKIAYYNPLGLGSYKAFVHSIRIVCMNTLRMAEAQGAANKSIHRISHTKSSIDKIESAVSNLAELFLGIENHKSLLSEMATINMGVTEVENFGKLLFGYNPEKEGSKSETRFKNNMMDLVNIFETQEGFDSSINRSRYAMLQAVTNMTDHEKLRKGNDEAFRSWDGLVGNNAKFKDKAFALLHPKYDLSAVPATLTA